MRAICFSLVLLASYAVPGHARTNVEEISRVKGRIFQVAESYQGQGDPYRTKQKNLEILVDLLLRLNPQPPLPERLPLLHGAWKQVWGPYAFDSSRGEDPTLDAANIYQVVSPEGYYYNVTPNLDSSGRVTQTILLRGEYRLHTEQADTISAQFTNLSAIPGIPKRGLSYVELPFLVESSALPEAAPLLPGFLVRWIFGGGTLREVYTDKDLRITFGSDSTNQLDNFIFVLRRVTPAEARPTP